MTTKSVDALLADIRLIDDERYQVVEAVRAVLKKKFKSLGEEVKYGGLIYSSSVQFCGIFAYAKHVSVEFSHGAAITDSNGHLEGAGKFRRHLKLLTLADIESKQLTHYLPLALQAARNAP